MDYKKYSLEKLEEWIHDCISSGEATPHEIYDVIKGVVEENYYYHKNRTSQAYELLALLNGNGKGHIKDFDDCVDKILSCDKDNTSPECKGAWNSFWEDVDTWSSDSEVKEDKVVKWQLPIEMDPSGEYFIAFPDDLLEAANLHPGDDVEWVDNNDGTFILRKPNAVQTNS